MVMAWITATPPGSGVAQRVEVARPVGLAHRFEHLDRNDAVEAAGRRRDSPAGGDRRVPPVSPRERARRSRVVRSTASCRYWQPAAGQPLRQAPQPQPISSTRSPPAVSISVDDAPSLRSAPLQGLRCREKRRRIIHAGIEPAARRSIAEVVVGGDVAPAAAPGIGAQPVPDAVRALIASASWTAALRAGLLRMASSSSAARSGVAQSPSM